MTILERLQNVFRDVFDDELIMVNQETKQSDIKDWDSLAHIRLILSCESEFKIKFTTSEFMNLVSVADFIKFIELKQV